MMHSEARNDINLSWIVAIAFLVVMNGLEFILLLLI
jgi:hypothetical protein